MVPQAAAGTAVDCGCGRKIRVPSLGELRARAGVARVSPDLEIAQLIRAGLLPEHDGCSACGDKSVETISCWIVCERMQVEDPSAMSWWTVLLLALFIPLGRIFLVWRPRETRAYGRDVEFFLPLPVCSRCRPMLSSPEAVKAVLRLTPVYARLLDKYPEAEIYLGSDKKRQRT